MEIDKVSLKEKVAVAKEAVADLDETLKVTAFETILNKLLSEESERAIRRKSKSKVPVKRSISQKSEESDETVQTLCNKINRTEHPEIFNLTKTLDRSLYILKISKEKLHIDGLGPSQISKVLTDNFRIKSTKNAVGMALMNAKTMVDRKQVSISGAGGFTYHIMHDGEEYLQKKLDEIKKVTNQDKTE